MVKRAGRTVVESGDAAAVYDVAKRVHVLDPCGSFASERLKRAHDLVRRVSRCTVDGVPFRDNVAV